MFIIDKFEKVVRSVSEHNALVSDYEGKMSYQKMNECANYIASELDAFSLVKDEVIGICMERSFSLLISILAVLKTGHAYLPLDASYPEDRIKYMIKNTNVKRIITTPDKHHLFDKYTDIDIYEEKEIMTLTHYMRKNEYRSDLFCVIYSSGSTGNPNGVMITNDSIWNTVNWAIHFYELSDKDVSLQIPSCSYVSSVQDYFSTFLSGGTLLMINDMDLFNLSYLHKLCCKYKVTHFDIVPSLYKEYVKSLPELENLRFVLLAGESLDMDLVHEHFRKFENVRLVNEYGMAETSSCFCYHELYKNSEEVFIGTPITNMEFMIESNETEVGELIVKGPGLAKGYYNNDSHTSEKFVDVADALYLRTGDVVKLCDNGLLKYIGRADEQVKVNGKRVNLSEIDHCLRKFAEVDKIVSLGIDVSNEKIIVTFICAKNKDKYYYYNIVKKHLPDQFIPNDIIVMDQFFYLPNNKMDLNRMKAYYIDILKNNKVAITKEYNEIYTIVCKHMPLLKNKVDENTDLKTAGIDSIILLKIIAEIEYMYQMEINYDIYNQMGTISIKNLKKAVDKLMGNQNV